MNYPSESDPKLVWAGDVYSGNIAYGFNYCKPDVRGSNCGVDMGDQYKPGASLAAVDDVSGTILITDAKNYVAMLDPNRTAAGADGSTCVVGSSGARVCGPAARHLGTVGAVFVDGHAKAMQWQTTMGSSDRSVMRYWTTSAE